MSLSWKPAPDSSFSRPAKIPLKSAISPPILGASPLFGALGLTIFLLFSWPAFEGNVGNMAADLGFGSSLKYGWIRTSLAVGLLAGFKDSREMRSSLPAAVKKGNLARMTAPTFCCVRGKRRDLAFGRRLKPGQFSSVGMPQSSKIYQAISAFGLPALLRPTTHTCLRELVDLVLPLEQWLFSQKLAEYAANTPHINLWTVLLRAEE